MSNLTLMFPGAGDVFIKFHDIIGTPMFTVLVKLIRGEFHQGLFNRAFFSDIPLDELIQWYIYRTKENVLDCLMTDFTPEENHKMMQYMLREVPYNSFPPVNLYQAFILHPICEHLHIYTDEEEPQIQFLLKKFEHITHTADYRYGNFRDIIRNVKDEATLITTSTSDARIFLDSKYKHRFVSLIYPNMYDDIRNISDIYSQHADQISIIDIRNKLKEWEDSL